MGKSSGRKAKKSSKKIRAKEEEKLKTSGNPVEKITNGLVNDEVKCAAKRVPKTPDHLPNLPLLAGAFGVCKSGKSNALVNLIQAYCDYGSLNLLYCISPTYDSNASLQTLPFTDETDDGKTKGFRGIFTDPHNSVAALLAIKDHIRSRNDDYKFEQIYKKLYKKYFGGLRHKLTYEEHSLLKKEDYRKPIAIPWPQPGIFIDDMTHTELMANSLNNELSHLCLHHRHLDGVGVSIFQAFQTFKSGMPPVVRTNISLIMLFSSCNMKELEYIYAEIANNVTFETFKRLLGEAVNRPHGFLLINKMADDPNRQYGINFDQVFVVDPAEERRKLLGM